MKYVVFFAALTTVYPLGCLLRRRPHWQLLAWTLIGALPFLAPPDINFVSYEHYRGDARGFEVTIIDLLILALYFALPAGRARSPYRLARYAYLLAALVALTQAPAPLFAAFGVWKILRMYALLYVVTRACADVRVPPAILRGMMLGVLCTFGVVVFQRYVLGMHQTRGLFPHPNSMAMAVNLVLPIPMALVLTGVRGTFPVLVALAGAISVVMSLSRGGLAVLVASCGMLYLASVAKRSTPRKFAVAVVTVVFAAGLLIKAGHTIIERFETATASSADDRLLFNHMAALMLEDHPLGIGLNQFSLAALQQGYVDRVVPDATDQRRIDLAGVAHNIYWLTLAEMGYLGFVSHLALVFWPMLMAFRHAWRRGGDHSRDLLLGVAVGLLALNLHGLLEWVWRQTEASYLFWLVAGIVATLVRRPRAYPVSALRHRVPDAGRVRPLREVTRVPSSSSQVTP